jgi:phosphoribosyl 1,2-cyclic phosphodiesterase
MLLHGPYPKWLKDRVMGPYGHLSNKDSAIYLAKIIGNNTKKILLTHLSHKNNTEEKALETIKEIFEEYEINFTDIKCAKQREKSELIEI